MVILYRQKQRNNQQNDFKLTEENHLNSAYKIWKVLRKMWQFLGVVPIMTTSKVLISLQKIWCIFLLLLVWLMCLSEIRYLIKFGTTVTKGFYSLEMLFYILLVSSIFYTTFINKNKFQNIYKQFATLYEQLKLIRSNGMQTYTPIDRQLKIEILFIAFWHLTFYCLCIGINIARFRYEPMFLFRILCVFYVTNILISANLCLFWMALRVISLTYAYSNKILETFRTTLKPVQTLTDNICHISSPLWYEKEFCTFNLRKSFKFNDVFVTFTEIRSILDQLLQDVIEMFNITLLLNFGNSFMLLAIHYFAFYKFFDSPSVGTVLMFLLKIGRTVMHMFNIVFILLSNQAVVNEKCHTIYILNSIPVESVEMEKNINGYLLQLMVRKHTVWVCDIFELDMTFLLSVISALSTYVIFLIQIDLGAATIEGNTATTTS